MGVEQLPRTIELVEDECGHCVRIVDQRVLPQHLSYLELRTSKELIDAICTLAVRGAPALGIAGAAAMLLVAEYELRQLPEHAYYDAFAAAAEQVATARPTAVNLRWGVERACTLVREYSTRTHWECGTVFSHTQLIGQLAHLVNVMIAEDEQVNRSIGAHGANLLAPGSRVLTHCNAGSLATAFYGTALGVVYSAYEQGKLSMVYTDETRPVCQGARLSAWELQQAGVPCTLICDNMAASLMAAGNVDAVIVGADRICANGDTANKIGTYGLAVLAAHHDIPFYVAAPTSTVDMHLADGSLIPIEERAADEYGEARPFGVPVYNPAFDVTPAALISYIITERGVFEPADIAQVFMKGSC